MLEDQSVIVSYSVRVNFLDILNFSKDEKSIEDLLTAFVKDPSSVDEESVQLIKDTIYDAADYYLTSGSVTPVIIDADISELID